MKKIILLTGFVAGLAGAAVAQPARMNYQGRLLDSGGQPLTNGTYELQFNIYDSPSGTNLIWGPFLCDDGAGDGHAARAVIANGRFNVILGPNDSAVRPLTGAFGEDSRFVEIRVNSGDPILPRQQFLSAPYALRSASAQQADHATATTIASNLVQELAEALCPAGSIVAFAGTNLPSGWTWCDGQELSRTEYSRLFTAIGTAWGPGNGSTTFNLPDLRGMFLRGVSGDSDADPDKTNRVARIPGGASGNAIGSYQADIFGSHNHTNGVYKYLLRHNSQNAAQYVNNLNAPNLWEWGEMQPQGGRETRPKNAYVHYIIKF